MAQLRHPRGRQNGRRERDGSVIGLLQRVTAAQVVVEGVVIAAIEGGLLVLVGVEAGDGRAQADRLLERLLGYRVFPDGDGKMNLSLRDIGGGLLLVPQFTLAADTTKGARPSFTPTAAPDVGKALFDHLLERARMAHAPVAGGRFGADMKVTLTNDGPVTFWLRAAAAGGGSGEMG
jgi:D-aminoacyl-tRNA deacylase